MDKKQFFESLMSLLPDNSGYILDSIDTIQAVLGSLRAGISDTKLRHEFILLEKKILFHTWMLEQICNGDVSNKISRDAITGPLIVISLGKEILFINKAYCELSGLSPADIQSHAQSGTLYSEVYEGTDIDNAQEAVSKLHAGKGYRHLELLMKHSQSLVSWNSYGGIGGSLEIRSGTKIHDAHIPHSEYERFNRGHMMNTARLIENLYQVSIHSAVSPENEQKLIWVQEFLSLFDFLWNHSELLIEIIDIPSTKTGKIYGLYNTVYSQFFKHSFAEKERYKKNISIAHGMTISEFLEIRGSNDTLSTRIENFHQYNNAPIAEIYWQYSYYQHEIMPGYQTMFSAGVFVQRIQRKNIFMKIFQGFFPGKHIDT